MRWCTLAVLLLSVSSAVAGDGVTHVAVVTGCNSHFGLHTSTIHTLQTSPRYRVTVVTEEKCRPRVENQLNATLWVGTERAWGKWNLPFSAGLITGILGVWKQQEDSIADNEATFEAVESLIAHDRPHVILSDHFNIGGVSAAADARDVPVGVHLAGGNPSLDLPNQFKQYPGLEGYPMWVQAGLLDVEQLLIEFVFKYVMNGNFLVANSRRSPHLPNFSGVHHMWHSYPVFRTTGMPFLNLIRETATNEVFGTLPESPKLIGELDNELMSFISKSTKPILYVSMGSHFAFSDQQFKVMIGALSSQEYFNVILSHSRLDPSEKFPANLLVRKKVNQVGLLAQEKVKVFWTHAGLNSYLEGILSGTVLICSPQGRDNFNNCHNVKRENLGLVVATSPTHQQIAEALKTVSENLESYEENVQRLLKTIDYQKSTERLFKFVDSLASTGRSSFIPGRSSGLNESLSMGIMLLFLLVVSCVVLIFIKLVSCLCRRKTVKPKTS